MAGALPAQDPLSVRASDTRPANSFFSGPGYGFSGLFGSQFSYDSRVSESLGNIRTFSVPVIIPLEATIGRFYMGGAFEYAVREYRQAGRNERVQGPRYLSAHGGFQFFSQGRFRLEARETVNAPIAEDDGRFEAPREAWLNSGGYRIDSDVTAKYIFDRADLRAGVGHQWRLAREDYDPGETILASMSFGYGFGNFSTAADSYPVTMLMGVTSRYNYADKEGGNRISGTEYGTVFFAPGLQLSSRSMRFQAMVEVPIYNVRPEDESYTEEVRANFGLKYYLD